MLSPDQKMKFVELAKKYHAELDFLEDGSPHMTWDWVLLSPQEIKSLSSEWKEILTVTDALE